MKFEEGIGQQYDWEGIENIDGFYDDNEFQNHEQEDENTCSDDLFDEFDEFVLDSDFSELQGDFKKSFKKVNSKIAKKGISVSDVSVPPERNIIIKGSGRQSLTKKANPHKGSPLPQTSQSYKGIGVKKSATLYGKNSDIVTKVIVPDSRRIIVQGASKYILSENREIDACKNIGYYKGKKLKRMIFTFNNDTGIDFNLELFNPSMPLDYLYSTSLNLNDRIEVAGSNKDLSYSDVLYNILANPTMIINAKFVFSQ